ncbi:DEKNAAC101853 [Brettanomyces naardenensis]|uniref:non-specific serine/threonine protein kinase n=1 Tax=Brettanomyces naardenensis TaxID=13370 RepID=A0A448YJA1_BRENA|nr:DEKNAAC101853 [Brettanomyces naardenensis]
MGDVLQPPDPFAQEAAQRAVSEFNGNRQLDRVVESLQRANKRLSEGSNSSKRKAENRIGPWRLGRTLGRGSTGRVRLAKHSSTGQLAAIKIIPKSAAGLKKQHGKVRVDEHGLPYGIEREIIIMKLISHPNIMGLYDVWENQNELYLVLEYVEGGELFDYLINHGRLTEPEAARYFRQIIDAVAYCHKFQICHRDLKPENILLDRNKNIKIADFGMAALETRQKLLETSCGSPHYASPEIVAGKAYHGSPSDVWSCGVILFALLTGHLPFDDPNIRTLLMKVQAGRFHMPSGLGPEAKDLIRSMLKVEPRDRILIDEISSHPFLRRYESSTPHQHTDSIARQLNNLDVSAPVNNPDPDILHNLQTLWHDVPNESILTKLSRPEANPEKMFYYLLQNYKRTHVKEGVSELDLCSARRSDDSSRRTPMSRLPLPPSKPTKSNSVLSVSSLVHSVSVVTTTIQDENGQVLQKSVKEIPNRKGVPVSSRKKKKHRQPLQQRTINVHTQSQVVPFKASTSFNRSVSFSSLKKRLNTGPPRPEKRLTNDSDLAEFKYLVDTIFEGTVLGDGATGSDRKSRGNSGFVSVLDPRARRGKLSLPSTVLGNTPSPLQRVHADSIDLTFSTDSVSHMGLNNTSATTENTIATAPVEAVSTPRKAKVSSITRSFSGRKSLKSNSTRNLSSFLDSQRTTITLDDYNKKQTNRQFHLALPEVDRPISNLTTSTATTGTLRPTSTLSTATESTPYKSQGRGKSFDFSMLDSDISYSVHAAVQVPIQNSSQDQFVRLRNANTAKSHFDEDKFADADEAVCQKNFIYDANANSSQLKVHRKADSASTQGSATRYPTIRCSLLNGSNYDLPEDTDKQLNLTPEKEKVKVVQQWKPQEVSLSVFADPEEDSADSAAPSKQNANIFEEENRVDPRVLDRIKRASMFSAEGSSKQSRSHRSSLLFASARMSLASTANRASSLFQRKPPDLSPADPVFNQRESHEEEKEKEQEQEKEAEKEAGKEPERERGIEKKEEAKEVARPSWFMRVFNSITKHKRSKTPLRRRKTSGRRSFNPHLFRSYAFIETDYLTSQQAKEFLLDKDNRRTNINIEQSPDSDRELICSFSGKDDKEKVVFKVEFEDQIGSQYGFGGCFVKIIKVRGGILTFNRCCKVIEENLGLLDRQKKDELE